MQFQREPQALQDDLENQTVEQLQQTIIIQGQLGAKGLVALFEIRGSEEMQRIISLLLPSAPHWTFEVENLNLV